jgi:hypothetical protein
MKLIAIGGVSMSKKRKKDPSTIGLNSSQVEGQGTTISETDGGTASSSRKKQKRG